MSEIDFEATVDLADSELDGTIIAIVVTGYNGYGVSLFISDPIMQQQEFLDYVTDLIAKQGYIRLAFIPRDVGNGIPPRANFFASTIEAVRLLTVEEVGG